MNNRTMNLGPRLGTAAESMLCLLAHCNNHSTVTQAESGRGSH